MNFVSTADGVGYLDGEEVVTVDLPHLDLREVLTEHGSLEAVGSAAVRRRTPLSETQLLSPVGRPGKIWGIGLNYRAKAAFNGREIPKDPVIFLKAPSAVGHPGGAIPIPGDMSDQVDYEGEIAIVIGQRTRGIPEPRAWDCIAGIMAANDVTARDVHARTANPTIAKSFDGFAPLGAALLSMDGVETRDDIGLRTTLNGAVVQEGSTSDLIFGVPEILALLSRYATLEPGDVVLTGTPPGTGSDRDRHLTDGDTVTVTVDGVAALTSTVVG